ncbi:MAG: hypothetical protein ABI148_07275 [Ginsengibacter sp.]
MKKFLIIVFSIIILLLACVYIFIPGKLEISKIEYIKCNEQEAYRALSNESMWQKWWPEKDGLIKQNDAGEEVFFYKGYRFQLTGKSANSIEVKLRSDLSIMDSRIFVTKLNLDSLAITWKCQIPTSINPVSRLLKFREAKDIKNNMAEILSQLRSFLNKNSNI